MIASFSSLLACRHYFCAFVVSEARKREMNSILSHSTLNPRSLCLFRYGRVEQALSEEREHNFLWPHEFLAIGWMAEPSALTLNWEGVGRHCFSAISRSLWTCTSSPGHISYPTSISTKFWDLHFVLECCRHQFFSFFFSALHTPPKLTDKYQTRYKTASS